MSISPLYRGQKQFSIYPSIWLHCIAVVCQSPNYAARQNAKKSRIFLCHPYSCWRSPCSLRSPTERPSIPLKNWGAEQHQKQLDEEMCSVYPSVPERHVNGRSWKEIWHLSHAAHTWWVMGLGSHRQMDLAKCGQSWGSSGWTGLPGKHRPAFVYMVCRLSVPCIHKPQILLGSFMWHPRWRAAQTLLQFGGYK